MRRGTDKFKPTVDLGPRLPRGCEFPGCEAPAEHRAPKARNRLEEYFWFCLEHVREYNKTWNFCAGMNEGEIEREIRNDTVWRRPTWPMGGGKKGAWYRYGRGDIGDDFGAFRGAADESSTSQGWRPVHNSPEDKAYRILGLEPSVSLTDLKARYKELVKLHHPDTHGGDKQAEERLKDINDAYATLRKCVTA